MAGKSLTQRLADLQKKKVDLDVQIKQIEQEQSRRLRQEKQERARIIGMAILRLVAQGDWTEDRLMKLVSPLVTSGKERRFLGLESPAISPKMTASEKSVAKIERDASSSKPPTYATVASVASKSSLTITKGKLPEASSEEDILSEFNL